MAFINYTAREIQLKIVYYGASGSGKTTNLKCLHHHLKAMHQSDLVSMPTEKDRTLFFEFFSLDSQTLEGFKTRFQLYTVPGQPVHNDTRQMILKGVDGIVFVVDSHADRMAENVESFENLQENLAQNHLSLAQIPFVLQYNKRDLPNAASLDYLQFAFNNRATKAVALEASASQEQGVLETLNALSQMLLAKFARFSEEGLSGGPSAPATSNLIEIVSH